MYSTLILIIIIFVPLPVMIKEMLLVKIHIVEFYTESSVR